MQELKELQRQGMSIQAISKLTGWDRKTIRKYVQAAGLAPEYGPRSASPSKLDAFKAYLEERGPGLVTIASDQVAIATGHGRNPIL
jgi:transposase